MEGEVYLSKEDGPRIAAHLSMEIADFEAKYIESKGRSARLRKPPDRQCLFHQQGKCAIHTVKPVQCRVFPYWPEIIETAEAWDETAKRCPGMNKGALVQIEIVREVSQEMRRAYPQMYPSPKI
jgi:Fe-S-cluster containining protein